MKTTYKIPFKTQSNKSVYWSLYDDYSGGFFCTDSEVLPLASVVQGTEYSANMVWEYLANHEILKLWIFSEKGTLNSQILSVKPVKVSIEIPKIVW